MSTTQEADAHETEPRETLTMNGSEALGDKGFEDFFRGAYEDIARALFLLIGDRSEAEEYAQGAMVRAWERWSSISAKSDPSAYVFTIGANLWKRSRRRHRLYVLPDGPLAADATERVEDGMELASALRKLTYDQRIALVLTVWLGLTTEEAGRLLGISPTSVRGRLHRARRVLRDHGWEA